MAVTLDVGSNETALVTPFPGFDITRDRRSEGDGTVPATSASALLPRERNSPGDVTFSKKQCEVTGVEHGVAMNDPTVQSIILALLNEILSQELP